MFNLQDPVCKTLRGVITPHRNHALCNNWAVIQHGGYKVHCTPMPLCAGGQRLLMGMQPRKGRQQGRVNIDQPPCKAFDKSGGQNPHEPRKQDIMRLTALNRVPQHLVKLFACCVVAM